MWWLNMDYLALQGFVSWKYNWMASYNVILQRNYDNAALMGLHKFDPPHGDQH